MATGWLLWWQDSQVIYHLALEAGVKFEAHLA